MRITQVVAVTVTAFTLMPGSVVAGAGVPQTMNYQGILKNSTGVPMPGSHSMTFRLYRDSTGGVPLWEEIRSVAVDSAGLFNALLGAVTPIPDSVFAASAYLATAVVPDAEMARRVPLSSVGYAYRVNSIDGAAGGSVTGDLYLTGKMGIGTAYGPLDKLHINGAIRWGNDGSAPYARSDEDASGLFIEHRGSGSWNEAMRIQASRSGDLTNYSQFVIDPTNGFAFMPVGTGNGNVGIGTTSPAHRLEVRSAIDGAQAAYIRTDATSGTNYGIDAEAMGSGAATNIAGWFAASGAAQNYAIIVPAGHGTVGIGTTSPRSDLDVNGAISAQGPLRVYGDLVNYHELRHNGTTGALEIAPIGGTDLVITNGSVGVGVSSPTAKLQVEGATVVNGPGGSANAITANTNGAYSGVAGINAGPGPGVYGESYATNGAFGAVTGKARADGGIGVYGETWSPGVALGSSVAIYGWAPASGASVGGAALGVLGRVNSYQGPGASVPAGVFGWATAATGVNAGLFGRTDSPDGFGVYSKGKLEVDGNINTNGVITVGSSSSKLSIGTYTASRILTVVQNSATDPIADAWTTYSSRRWKENIVPITGALDKVSHLRGVYFDWKATGKHDLGMVAEEVGEVLPEIVQFEDNGKDAQSLDYSRLTAVLIEAVKELKVENDSLRGRLSRLEGVGRANAVGSAPASGGSY